MNTPVFLNNPCNSEFFAAAKMPLKDEFSQFVASKNKNHKSTSICCLKKCSCELYIVHKSKADDWKLTLLLSLLFIFNFSQNCLLQLNSPAADVPFPNIT